MNKKYLTPVLVLASMTILQSPAYSQQVETSLEMPTVTIQQFGFQPSTSPARVQRAQPGLENMMQAWEQETDPQKKARLARQIQTRVGVKADGVIGRQTLQAIQQAGGQAGTSVVDFGGSQFRGNLTDQMAPQGGFFGNLFAPRPAQPANPALGNMMREWELEPDPNKKRMIAMEIQRGLGVKADGVIGRQTMQAVQQAGGMPGGGGMGGPALQGGALGSWTVTGNLSRQPQGFNPNPGQRAQGGFFSNLFAPRPAQPANPALGNMMREWELEPDPKPTSSVVKGYPAATNFWILLQDPNNDHGSSSAATTPAASPLVVPMQRDGGIFF